VEEGNHDHAAIHDNHLCRLSRRPGNLLSAVIARNGLKLYHLAEALSMSEALEKVAQEMRLEDKNSAAFR